MSLSKHTCYPKGVDKAIVLECTCWKYSWIHVLSISEISNSYHNFDATFSQTLFQNLFHRTHSGHCGQNLNIGTHYNDIIVSAMASQITGVSIVCSTVGSSADQRKRQSSASLAFVRGIHRWPANSSYKGPVTRIFFPFDDVIKGWISREKFASDDIISILRWSYKYNLCCTALSLI